MKFKESDLVLKVSKNVNPDEWDEGFYQKFLDILCLERKYQKDAVEVALRFLNSGEYKCTEDLAKENYDNNFIIRERWNNNYKAFIKDIDLSDKLCATIDLATATGKSYIMFAIAVIMLASKKVDRVLILVPSITIETELTNKFKELTSNNVLFESLSLDYTPPQIINGDTTMITNSIVIENRDAIYKSQEMRNSIVDSLKGKGCNTLVLNDEVHHVYYSEHNEWKSFILDERKNDIDFKYVLGFTGTAYGGKNSNDYFSNVIYRYSLREAIENGYVKDVQYISKEDIPTDNDERWQVILNSHEDIAKKLPKELEIKPITIVITSKKTTADSKAKMFKNFLMKKRNLSQEEVDHVVLCVHSGKTAALDRIKLKDVDNKNSKVEFIFSVSMLTEGWDVKRVFQIVPEEERAFNSKLLIAQVLGRGLRIPIGWKAEWGIPKVTVFNHEKWSPNVKALVNEVLEFRKLLKIRVLPESKYNFSIYNVRYRTTNNVKEFTQEGGYNLWENGVNLPTDNKLGKSTIIFSDIKDMTENTFKSNFEHETYSINEITELLYNRFEDIDNEKLIKEYQKKWTKPKIKQMIEKSLKDSGNEHITKNLKNRFLSSMNVIFRNASKVVSYDTIPEDYFEISTNTLPVESNEIGNFKKNKVIFYNSEIRNSFGDDISSKTNFEEIIDSTNGYKHKFVENKYNFKCPQQAIVTTGEPEKLFMEKLIDNDVSNGIDAFIKSDDFSFYNINYSWQKGSHQKNSLFNPDWFIKQGENIIIVEVKDDSQLSDPDIENIGKNKAAIKHFDLINKYLEETNTNSKYKFTFITPKDFELFFEKLKKKEILSFKSNLDVRLIE